ncbi:hypothetical protein LINGRAHAP2_LOCUS5579 [Linum grandiflorum]
MVDEDLLIRKFHECGGDLVGVEFGFELVLAVDVLDVVRIELQHFLQVGSDEGISVAAHPEVVPPKPVDVGYVGFELEDCEHGCQAGRVARV